MKPVGTEHLPLFEPPAHTLARTTNPGTSHHAAAKRQARAAQRAQILATIRAYGPMNADRCDELCGWPMGTTGRRLHEMVDVVETTGAEAPTRRGGKGEVWRVRAAHQGTAA